MELHEVQEKINALSLDLDLMGDEMFAIATEIYGLKKELEEWTSERKEAIRSKEKNGTLEMNDGRVIKLTDAGREDLAKYGKKDKVAHYEALKRKADKLEIAIKAKIGALSGQQSLSSIIKKQMELV